eukprot:1134494-Pelagomonas_calceolata.AAC.2
MLLGQILPGGHKGGVLVGGTHGDWSGEDVVAKFLLLICSGRGGIQLWGQPPMPARLLEGTRNASLSASST